MQCFIIFGLELHWHFCGGATFPLTSTSSLRNVSLHRHDSSLLNFDLKAAIDETEGEEEKLDEDDEKVLVISVALAADDDNDNDGSADGLTLSVGGNDGVRVIV